MVSPWGETITTGPAPDDVVDGTALHRRARRRSSTDWQAAARLWRRDRVGGALAGLAAGGGLVACIGAVFADVGGTRACRTSETHRRRLGGADGHRCCRASTPTAASVWPRANAVFTPCSTQASEFVFLTQPDGTLHPGQPVRAGGGGRHAGGRWRASRSGTRRGGTTTPQLQDRLTGRRPRRGPRLAGEVRGHASAARRVAVLGRLLVVGRP